VITEIPTVDEFQYTGSTFLNLAWDSLITALFELDDLIIAEGEERDFNLKNPRFAREPLLCNIASRYWQLASKPLSISLALAEQGIEFLLKSRIIEHSPFLLISRNPKEWPRKCDRKNTPFSQFQTIEAQDLLLVHDTVAETRLPDDFKTRHGNLRRKRNVILHTVDPSLKVLPTDVAIEILQASNHLIGVGRWFEMRRDYLEKSPGGVNMSEDDIYDRLTVEADRIVDILSPSQLQSLLGFSKRSRRYYCPKCRRHAWKHREVIPRLAQLKPNSPSSTNIYCFVCGTNAKVIRDSCIHPECKGNVIEPSMPSFFNEYPPKYVEFEQDGEKKAHLNWYNEDGSLEILDLRMRVPICLSCWEYQEKEEST
jgi:hypothetical protein